VQESLLETSSAPLVGYLSSLALRVGWRALYDLVLPPRVYVAVVLAKDGEPAMLCRTAGVSLRRSVSFLARPQIAEAEADSGGSGSRAVHDAALEGLLYLLHAISGTTANAAEALQPAAGQAQRAADALAFFLPGIAVGLCKALLLAGPGSGSSRSGAAGPISSSAGVVAVLRALVTLLTACLCDAVVAPALHGVDTGSALDPESVAGRQDSNMPDAAVGETSASLQQALQQLHRLSQQAKQPSKAGSSPSKPQASDTATAAQQLPHQHNQQQEQQQGQMRVQRTADWVHDTALRLDELLRTALPPLAAHHRPSVREALAVGMFPSAPVCMRLSIVPCLLAKATTWQHRPLGCCLQVAASFWTPAAWRWR
jgi:hypothetical protein